MQKSVFGVFVDIFGTYSYIFINDDYLIWPILYDKKHVLLRQFVKLLIILKDLPPNKSHHPKIISFFVGC